MSPRPALRACAVKAPQHSSGELAGTVDHRWGACAPQGGMTMRREVLIALAMLALAGCATTHTSDTQLNSNGGQLDPALARPDLGSNVTGGIQTRELNSVTLPGR